MRSYESPGRCLVPMYSLLQNTLYFVDYYGKFPVVKKTDDLLADNMIGVVKIVSAKYGLPKKTVLDAGTNLIPDKFRQFEGS